MPGGPPSRDRPPKTPLAERSVYLVATAVFAVATAFTLRSVASMSGGMLMPGNWTMSMMWMRMPEQTWLEAAIAFASMWLAMMIVMMLPSAFPTILLYRRALAFRDEPRLALHITLLGVGYFLVWLAFGVMAYAVGVGVAALAMASESASRAVPLACGAALVIAGLYQLTPWKSACLRHCRNPLAIVAEHLGTGRPGALALGLHHGALCAACCWGLMVIQLTLGIMNLGAMVLVAVVIAAEKLWFRGEAVARATGVAAIAGGVIVVASSLG
jgi:predicted metal-binding membrane protein